MLLAYLRKLLFEIETLPPAPTADSGALSKRRSRLGLLVAPEELPLDPVSPPMARGNWIHFLLGAETLDELPPAPRYPAGMDRGFSWLLRPEELGTDPVAEPDRRPGWLSSLLAAEDLGPEPPAVARPGRGRWLEWLFAPEKLEPPPKDPP